jgi:hypothetical protein
VDWFTPRDQAVLSYSALRRAIGLIGLLLPAVLAVGGLLLGGGLAGSISSYYYTPMRNVFVGALCAMGVFLLCYRFGRLDDVLGDVGGIAAIGVALFPTTPDGVPRDTVGVLHLAFAAVFFLTLAAFAIVLFTRSASADPDRGKRARNVVYRVCGWLIVACLVLIVLADVLGVPGAVFWLESAAVMSFGVAWTVKGGALRRASVPAQPS